MDNVEQSNWRLEKRQQIDQRFTESSPGESESYVSPSRRYMLQVTQWSGDTGWAYVEAKVSSTADDTLIATVRRNYGMFPFSWCEDHPSGHDYLLCGEDYQGQTVIELDTGERSDYLPDEAEQGHGFCWASYDLTADKMTLLVDGCYWGAPYELVAFNFNEPMQLPYLELHRWSGDIADNQGFDPSGNYTWVTEVEVRAADGKPLDELTEADMHDLLLPDNTVAPGAVNIIRCRNTWRDGTPFGQTTTQQLPG